MDILYLFGLVNVKMTVPIKNVTVGVDTLPRVQHVRVRMERLWAITTAKD
jgi:hypothetical protein